MEIPVQRTCPRCAYDVIDQLFLSPVAGAWEVLQCRQCLYCWRTSEPARRSERQSYPKGFRLERADIAGTPEVPAIPALRTAPS
jgi:rubredoxin